MGAVLVVRVERKRAYIVQGIGSYLRKKGRRRGAMMTIGGNREILGYDAWYRVQYMRTGREIGNVHKKTE